MSSLDPRQLRRIRERERRARARRRRLVVLGAIAVVAVAIVAVAATSGGSSPAASGRSARRTVKKHRTHRRRHHSAATTVALRGTGKPGTASVPILMYHVINPPPAGAPFPGLYVPAPEFVQQMQALKSAGYHGVTLNQLEANRTRGVPLGPGKPIVITFDNGYASQYTNALPELRRLGWPAVENIQLSGLPPSQGGLTEAQVNGLLSAGWELDTQGISHADLIALNSAELHYQVVTARRILQKRYGVPVDWFCYPSGHYNATVIAEVKVAGYVGSTTVVPGWATPGDDPFRLPRLRVLGGTTGSGLLAQIASTQGAPAPPPAYGGSAGTA